MKRTLVLLALCSAAFHFCSAQIGGSGWSPATVKFNVQWPYNVPQSSRYTLSNGVYHCWVFSNDLPFKAGSTTLPRTEQRFTPDYTNGEIQYQATMMASSNENSYCVFQIHSGDAQSPTYGSTTFMLFWFSGDGGSVHDYSGKELAKNLGNQWFQLNVDHNLVTRTIKVWVNRQLVWTQQDNGAGDFYMKDGVYEQSHGPTLQMDTWITNNIQMWTSSGTNPPAAPTGLAATPGLAQIGLSWTASSDAASYNLKRSTVSGGSYVALTNTTATNYTDANVTNGTIFYYVLSAVDSFGESANSSEVAAALAGAGFQLSAAPPTAAISSGGGASFTVTMSTNAGFTGTTSFGLTGLPPGATATFSPAALRAAGISTLNVQTAGNTPGGSYVLTILGTNGGSIVTTAATLVVSGATANLGTLLWTSASGTDTNWSTIRNWTNFTAGGYGPPGISNNLTFTNIATASASALAAPGSGLIAPANINAFVDSSFAVAGLTNLANSINTSPVYHNLGIADGATLTAGGVQIGGFSQFDFGANNVVNMTVSGAGAALLLTNGALVVSQGSSAAGAHDAALDLSGLDTFLMNGAQIKLGVENITRAAGILYLAKTNALTLTTAGYANSDGSGSPSSGNPALYLGHNKSALGNGAQLYLGVSNSIAVDYVTVGRGDANDLLEFNPAFLAFSPSVAIQGLGGAGSRVGVYVVGDGSAGQGGSFVATNDFSGGIVNAIINYLCVGRGRQGAGDTTACAGLLTLDNGTINANTLAVGFLYPSGSNSIAVGTVNVNGGTLTVISNLTLASRPNVGGAGTAQATLNLNGGTVQATNILGAGGISAINLNSGRLDLQSGNPAPGQIANISTLNVGAAAVNDPALLANAASITASNSILIAPNGTLAGNTLITAPGLTVNGAISPGTVRAGWITNNGPLTLGAGGRYLVTVQDALAGPLLGWSFLKSTAGIDVQADAADPFTLALQTSGLAANFDFHTNYDWRIAAANSGITNFDPAKFEVDDSLFVNDLAGGYFFVRSNNSSLILSFTNNHPPLAASASFYRTGTVTMIPLASLAPCWSDPDGDAVALAGVNTSSVNGANNVGADTLYIYYTNANNVADAILYTVQDIRTNPPAVYQPGDTVQTAPGVIHILPPPALNSALLDPANLVLSARGGIPNQTCCLLTSTNLALPLANWTILTTNSFDNGGAFQLTNPIAPATPQRFYLLRLP